jgi:predicted XRE-type DNA-binding protein
MEYKNAFEPFYEKHDAVVMKAKSLAMIALVENMRNKAISQVEMAKTIGISQPRLSNLNKGMIHKFSLDSLMRMCIKAGIQVSFSANGRVSE